MTLVALAASFALFGCGDDDSGSTTSTSTGSGGDTTQQQAPKGAAACVQSWNAATKDVRAQASLSHRGDTAKDVYVGTYSGAGEFTATGESYDAGGSPTSTDITVAPGDCVAVDRTGSDDADTNWVMVAPKANGGGKSWYFLDETGDSPLAKSPQPLEGEATVAIMGLGEDAKLIP
jgi:hypothetical protein